MWKNDQKNKRVNQNLRLAFIALLILGLLLVCGWVFQFFQEFQKPFYGSSNYQRSYSWDGKSTINLIIAKIEKTPQGQDLQKLNFVSLNPSSGTLDVIKLSDEIYLEVPKNFGFWKLASIYKLGYENNPAVGEDLLKMSVSRLMALPIDGIIEVTSKNDLEIEQMVDNWKKNLLSGINFLTAVKTDLSLKEAADFVLESSKIRSDKITTVDFFKSAITQSKLLPDSSRVLGVDAVKLDTFVKQTLLDTQISDEDLTIAVFNGTNHPGLTTEAVRLINNLGTRVTIISNSGEQFVKSGVYINPEAGEWVKKSQTFKRLSQIFAPVCLNTPCQTADTEVASSRADISIVLGEEYFNYWFSR